MLHIFNLTAVGLILCNLLGLGLAANRICADYALAKVAAPVALAALLFPVEHYVGLGNLFGLWPLTTAASLYLIFRRGEFLKQHWRLELVALVAFCYPFLWRYAFPDIDSNSERMTNLGFITTHMSGGVLPPQDNWFPPYRLDVYYTFQHYAAALLGRGLGLDAGSTYNLSFCVCTGLTITAAAATIRLLATGMATRLLALAGFVFGGTGATLIVHKMLDHVPDLWAGMRFIGDTTKPDSVSTEFGKWFVAASYPTPTPNPVKLPMENFAYLMSLGDYHAPLSGFLLLLIALLAMTTLYRTPTDRSALAILVGSVPLSLAANTWLFPLQSTLVGAWVVFEFVRSRSLDWRTLSLSAGVGFALVFPFLRGFALQALDFKTSLRLVGAAERTPWLPGLTQHWPLLAMLVLGVFGGRSHVLLRLFACVFTGLYIFSELVYVDDIYSGEFNRFNTTLKWWPYIQAGVIIAMGALLLEHRNRVLRYATTFVLLILCTYAGDLGHYWLTTAKPHLGRLDGSAWLTDDLQQKAVLDYLKVAPPGVVLERLPTGAFTYAGSIAMFSAHPSMLGWQAHEQLWRGYRGDILTLYNETAEFYKGTKADSRDWLLQHNVKYVVWLSKDNVEPYTAFALLDNQIKSAYAWKEFHVEDKTRIGIWVRRNND
jgi:uncharacterized membrane protein